MYYISGEYTFGSAGFVVIPNCKFIWWLHGHVTNVVWVFNVGVGVRQDTLRGEEVYHYSL